MAHVTSSSRNRGPRRRRSLVLLLGAAAAVGAVVAVVLPMAGSDAAEQAEPAAQQVAPVAAASDAASPVPITSAERKKAAAKLKIGYAPPSARLTKPKKETGQNAIPATPTVKAKNIPAYPPDGRSGRRVVYSKALMHVWIVDDLDRVVRHYPVIGRWDRPAKGVYKVYSKSLATMNASSRVTFFYMVRFAWGKEDSGTAIGFHNIPRRYEDKPIWDIKEGTPVSKQTDLGLPIANGGCVRAADDNARFLYYWVKKGDTVVVLPTSI